MFGTWSIPTQDIASDKLEKRGILAKHQHWMDKQKKNKKKTSVKTLAIHYQHAS